MGYPQSVPLFINFSRFVSCGQIGYDVANRLSRTLMSVHPGDFASSPLYDEHSRTLGSGTRTA